MGDRFGWATDWFDTVSRGNDRPALVIVEADGASSSWTYNDMAHRSDQVAAHLETLGVRRGDHVMLMLGNQVELWESMLALMKLGAVVFPTTAALRSGDLRDRMVRGRVSHVIAGAGDAEKFAGLEGDYGRICTRGDAAGWARYEAAYGIADPPQRQTVTAITDPALVYFTSGTTSRPKLVEHNQVSYAVGHLTTMYWTGVAARGRALEHQLSGLGQARLELLFRAVDRGGDHLRLPLRSLRRARAARATAIRSRQHVLRAADGMADAHPGRSRRAA